MERGELWWAALGPPRGSAPGYRRPVLVVQADAFNRSRIQTIVVVPITTSLHLGDAPGNVRLSRRQSGLARDSVVNISQLLTVDRAHLVERIGRVLPAVMREVDDGLLLVLGLLPRTAP